MILRLKIPILLGIQHIELVQRRCDTHVFVIVYLCRSGVRPAQMKTDPACMKRRSLLPRKFTGHASKGKINHSRAGSGRPFCDSSDG